MRIRKESHFLAVVEAAQESGWSIKLMECKKIQVGTERFPALVFAAVNPQPIDDGHLLAFWTNEDISRLYSRPMRDTLAVCVFNQLLNKNVIKSEQKTFDDGHTMRTTIGTAGPFGYCFSRATTGFTRLMLVPSTEVSALQVRFEFSDDEALTTQAGKKSGQRKKGRK